MDKQNKKVSKFYSYFFELSIWDSKDPKFNEFYKLN